MDTATLEAVLDFFNLDPQALVLGINFIGTLLIIALVWAVVWYFVSAIGFSKMYKKAGESAWKAFIPYYRNYVRYKLAWKPLFFLVYLVSILLVQFVPNSQNIVLDIIVLAAGITMLVTMIKLDIYTAKSFGKGAGCGVLLFFFPFITSLVLGFGKAQYIGNVSKKA